jgi:hypothetical protein
LAVPAAKAATFFLRSIQQLEGCCSLRSPPKCVLQCAQKIEAVCLVYATPSHRAGQTNGKSFSLHFVHLLAAYFFVFTALSP